jgi:hypothetical protein
MKSGFIKLFYAQDSSFYSLPRAGYKNCKKEQVGIRSDMRG